MATQREYLVSLGLAQPTRGRFSTVAKEALAKAIAEGMQFDDLAPKEEKAKITIPAVNRDEFKDISPKAAREWAAKNPDLIPADITIAPKGRLDWRVKKAYKENVTKVVTRADEDEAMYGPNPRPRFPEHIMFQGFSADGKKIVVDGVQVCAGDNGCGYSLWYCRCPGDPIRYTQTSAGVIAVKPVNA